MSGCSHDACGGNDLIPYECRRCGVSYCSDHRLPEAHECVGLVRPDSFGDLYNESAAESTGTVGVLATLLVLSVVLVVFLYSLGIVL